MNKHKHLCFSFFDFDIWLGCEWEVTLTILQIGQRSLISFSAGKNWKTSFQLFYFWQVINQEAE
jgi:hypothetical protein